MRNIIIGFVASLIWGLISYLLGYLLNLTDIINIKEPNIFIISVIGWFSTFFLAAIIGIFYHIGSIISIVLEDL